MNRSYTKIRKIQEANILLEQRRFLTEAVSKYDKAKPNENMWYVGPAPKSTKTPKEFGIFVKQFGKEAVDPISLPEFKEFESYFILYPTEQDANVKFNEFYNKLIAKQTNPSVTTTTTTLKPGQTTPSTGTTQTNSTEFGHDDLVNAIASNLSAQGVGK